MSRRGGTRVRPTKHPIIVVAGEDRNDRLALHVLLEELCPRMCGRIVEISDSVKLRDAGDAALTARVDTLARKVKARAARENAAVACVFVHEDLDNVDSEQYPIVRERVAKALQATLGTAHYALAVTEIEAWLFLFPEALTAVCGSWSVPTRYR